jgi:transcriptional regulator with XRE-family HTH domain
MMVKTNSNLIQMSDTALIGQIGTFIKGKRTDKNLTQAQLAQASGLNRWTISQIENGESINLSSLIQILRALDSLYVLSEFEYKEVISPLEYAKLKSKQKQRVRNKSQNTPDKEDLGW